MIMNRITESTIIIHVIIVIPVVVSAHYLSLNYFIHEDLIWFTGSVDTKDHLNLGILFTVVAWRS